MRDRALLDECSQLQDVLRAHATLASLTHSPQWPALERRIEAVLSRPMYSSAHPSHPAAGAGAAQHVRAVHWNIEHGNRFEEIERALRGHPRLAGADLVLLNEVDLGMARSGNRDVAAELGASLQMNSVFAPMLIETTIGRDDDARSAAGEPNQEALFGLAILSRHPIGAARIVPLPGPAAIQFDRERMFGRHVALIAEIQRPGAPYFAVSTHLEVLRTREHRTAQVRVLMSELTGASPVILAGDFNSQTFDRGGRFSRLSGAAVLATWPPGPLRARLLRPDRGPFRERLFDELRRADFEWERFNDGAGTLSLRFDRLDEVRSLPRPWARALPTLLGWAERRARLRLDWFAGRGWRGGRGFTVSGLDGPGQASDHAPIVAEFDRA